MTRAASTSGADPARRRFAPGLSARLLLLTIVFVMLAEVLIYVPSVANFRRTWLNDRLAAAQVAALVLDAAPPGGLPRDLERKLLESVGAIAVAVRGGGTRRLLAASDTPPRVERVVDLRASPWYVLIRDAFATLLAPAGDPIRVVGAGMEGVDFVEIVLDEAPLRKAMVAFSRNILILSLIISGITAGLVYLALQIAIVRPVRRLSANLARFSDDPEDTARVLTPSGRGDEIGMAEEALERMERALADELRQKRRLADLGLGVSKVNHELRNMLTTAQLLGDRLASLPDPAVQRFAPRLIATLGRAVAFSEATLAYGRSSEPAPKRQMVAFSTLVEPLADLPGLAPGGDVTLVVEAPDDLTLDADPEQIARVLVNLVRNAIQALAKAPGEKRVTITARREDGVALLSVHDTGPGVPERARAHLFEPFTGSARSGGTGLGLPICAEILRLHGGSIVLDDAPRGACFRITLPDRV